MPDGSKKHSSFALIYPLKSIATLLRVDPASSECPPRRAEDTTMFDSKSANESLDESSFGANLERDAARRRPQARSPDHADAWRRFADEPSFPSGSTDWQARIGCRDWAESDAKKAWGTEKERQQEEARGGRSRENIQCAVESGSIQLEFPFPEPSRAVDCAMHIDLRDVAPYQDLPD